MCNKSRSLSLLIAYLVLLALIFICSSGFGYFTLAHEQDKWWLVDQTGKSFYSIGLNNIIPEDNTAPLGAKRYSAFDRNESLNSWSVKTLKDLNTMGFNTLGCWSSEKLYHKGLPYFILLEYPWDVKNRLVDIYQDSFRLSVQKLIHDQCLPRLKDPDLIGYFIGNDLMWFGDFPWYNGHESYLFDMYYMLPSNSPGFLETQQFIRNYYQNIDNLNKAWPLKLDSFTDITNKLIDLNRVRDINRIRAAFLHKLSDYYYKTITEAVRKADTNHLIFSDRLANSVPEAVLRNAGKYCDAIAINYYRNKEGLDIGFLSALYTISRKPVLISEFSFIANDNTSGLPNKNGAFMLVKDQQARADSYKASVTAFSKIPFIIGSHWFQFFDDPVGGRAFDQQECNFGIYDIYGKPYQPLFNAMRQVNPLCSQYHSETGYVIDKNKAVLIEKITVRNSFKAQVFNGVYYEPVTGKNTVKQNWGDFENGAKISYQDKESGLALSYDTGSGYGCGMALFSENYEQHGYLDASGYKGISIKIKLPKNVKYQLHINESGADKPWIEDYPGKKGADGESYCSALLIGTGETSEYKVPFTELKSRSVWGNQVGNKVIDIQAIYNIEIYLEGKQGSGTGFLESISLF